MLLKIAQNGGKFKFQNIISFKWIDIFQFLSVLRSLYWVFLETVIRYSIILKTKFGANFVTPFSRQNSPNLKNSYDFRVWRVQFVVAKFQIARILKTFLGPCRISMPMSNSHLNYFNHDPKVKLMFTWCKLLILI